MVKLEVYAPSTTLQELGTIKSIVGKGGTIDFILKNFNTPEKRVVVLVKNKAGESGVIACSSAVSKHLRAAKAEGKSRIELLGWVANLNVLENEEGQYFVSLPAGEQTEGVKLDSLKAVEAEKIFSPAAMEVW